MPVEIKKEIAVAGAVVLSLAALLEFFYFAAEHEQAARPALPQDQLSKAVEQLTGSATRVVWCQHANAGQADPFAITEKLVLRGIDTQDGLGDRAILREKGNYSRPLLSHDGRSILYTDKQVSREGEHKSYDPIIYRTDWAGSAPVKLRSGYAVDCWVDPVTGVEWVYAVDGIEKSTSLALVGSKLFRFRLEDPQHPEVIYRQSRVSPDNIQLSRDGSVASGMAPWPKAGLFAADEAEGPFLELGFGCWTSTSPDSSRLLWVLDGSHQKVVMLTADGTQRWDVALQPTGEGTEGQFYHPRWSNHARVIAVTGPYLRTPETGNRSIINQGGATADVYLGRLSATADKVEKWLQLTNSGRGDAYPDVWVAEGYLSELQLADATVPGGR